MNPLMYRYVAYLGIALAALAFAYYEGFSHEHDKLIAYQAEVAQKAKDQNDLTKQKDAENVKQTQYVAQSLDAYYKQLYANLNRVQHQPANSGQLPQTSNSNQANDGARPPIGGTCPSQEFYAKALITEQRLEEWMLWAQVHNLEVQ